MYFIAWPTIEFFSNDKLTPDILYQHFCYFYVIINPKVPGKTGCLGRVNTFVGLNLQHSSKSKHVRGEAKGTASASVLPFKQCETD